MSNFTRKIIRQDNLRFRDSLGIDSPFLDKFFTKNTLKQNYATKKVRVIEVIPVNIDQTSQLISANNEDANLFVQFQNQTGLFKAIYAEQNISTQIPSKDDEGYMEFLSSICLGQNGGFFFTNETISPDSLVEVSYDETDRNAPVILNKIISTETTSFLEAAKGLFDSKQQSSVSTAISKNPSAIEGLELFKGAHQQEFEKLNQQTKQKLSTFGLGDSRLRKDAAYLFGNAVKEAKMLGVELTTIGGFTTNKKGGPSMHYLGLAHDFTMPSGMTDLNKNKFVVVYEGGRQWTVYGKTSLSSVKEITVNATIANTNVSTKTFSLKEVPYTGRLVNITKLMAKYGFVPISAKNESAPPTKNYGQYTSQNNIKGYAKTEWWHFQLNSALKPGDLYGEQLLKIMTESEAKALVSTFGNWEQVKNYKYGSEFR